MSMDRKIINQIKALGIDMIQESGSGHPGIVLGAATTLYTVYAKCLNFKKDDPLWINRDRFVLASGHASALLYTMLHLSGYQISMDDLKNFGVTIPPLQEQQAIVAHIEDEVGKIDSRISRANRRIELLEELKQSIITEAVTGKIKVC